IETLARVRERLVQMALTPVDKSDVLILVSKTAPIGRLAHLLNNGETLMKIVECFRVTALGKIARADVVQRHVERAFVAEFFAQCACFEIEIEADLVMSQIRVGQSQAVEDQRSQFSVAGFLTQRETLLVQLNCKLVSTLRVVNIPHRVQRLSLPFLIATFFKDGETFLPVIDYFLWGRAAVVNLRAITRRLPQDRRDKTESKDQQSERLSKRDRQGRPSLAGLT